MTRTIVLFSTLLISIISYGQTNNHEFNFGFETINSQKQLPDKWFQWGSGYKLKVDTITKHSGKNSILIEPIGQKSPNSFGCVAYSIPSKYEGKEIELRAYMKLDKVADGTIGLMIRVDGSSGTLGFENMQSKNIQGTKDWTQFEVKIPFPENGKTIYIGAMLSGTGQLWVDDFQLLLDGKDISHAKYKIAKEYKADTDKEFDNGSKLSGMVLTESKIEDLDVLGKIWGYLKYYHPSVADGEYNWDYELFRMLPKVIDVKNQRERNSILNSWVLSLGGFETIRIDSQVNDEIKLAPDLSWINQKALGAELVKSLNKVKSAKRPTEHYYIGKMAGVGNPEFKNERPYGSMSYPDQGFRLLCLYRYWNMIAYYFPYKNLIGEDWNAVLGEYVPRFINSSNELEYKLNSLSLIARIHDTHANIWGMDNTLNEFRGQKCSPLEITFVENKAIVTDYFDKTKGEKTGLKIGDAIEIIDNKTIDEIVKEKLKLTPASNYPTQLRDIARNLLRTNKNSLNITYWDGKQKVSTQIETFNPTDINAYAKYQKSDTCFKVINSDIAYIYPGSIKNEHLPKIMDEVFKTKGLIIDFRCYPSDFVVFSLSEYLLPESRSFVKFSSGSIESPGLFTMTNEIKVGKSNPDYYKGTVVIIINETTQSSAEYHTMAFRTAPKAKVIGSTTAGADGNVSRIVLPGGMSTMISGIGVYYPDGTETQRIGIVPDIEAKPTIQGVKDKKDELLEMAIKIINGG
jgi:bifunctional DNA-binding transcriptional regulator/antitoxin component of YhaV-PrlF toxin-antitoxin module